LQGLGAGGALGGPARPGVNFGGNPPNLGAAPHDWGFAKKLYDLNIEPPDDIERKIPDWVFPTQQNLPTRHQSCPDGVLVMPIEGRGRHLDPKQIPPKDRDIHFVEFKFCLDINPQQTLEKAHNQHQLLIQRLQTRSLRGISRNNQVTLHVILLGVVGTIYI